MSPAGALSDFRASEMALSALLSAAVLIGGAVALSRASLDRPAAVPEIDLGAAIPVRITPVIDLDTPLLKLGGQRDLTRLPDRWVKQTPKPRVEQKSFVSTKAGKTEADVPPPEVKVAEAKTPPPPPDAELAKHVDAPAPEVVDAGAPANVDEKGHADGVKEGTETDPLKARAVDLYRAKIAGWFSGRFRVSGSGMAQAELTHYRVAASVEIGADRTVTGYTIVPSGNPVFDAAARASLESARGKPLPPPPENYPDVVQSRINVTFVCRENRCD